jgi:type III secretion protein C
LGLGLAGLASGASAAPAPLPARSISLDIRDKPVGNVLRDLAAEAQLEAVISPSVTGRVNGVFNGPIRDIYHKIADAFHLKSYFDGVRIFVYLASDERSRRFGQDQADSQRIFKRVQQLGLADQDNRIQIEADAVVATGAPRFLEQVAAAAARIPERPAVRGAAAAPTKQAPPHRDEDIDYRVYLLKYAWATDVKIAAAGQVVTLPGVATILRPLIAAGERDDAQDRVEPTVEPESRTRPGLAGSGLASESAKTKPATSLGAGLADLLGYAANSQRAVAERPVDSPQSAPAPKVTVERPRPRIEADGRLNAIIIRDTPAHLEAYDSLIRQLDREPGIVEIEATIIDVDLERVSALGFQFEYQGSSGTDVLITPTSSGQSVAATPQQLVVSAVIGDRNKFLAGLQALESKGAAHIVSRPLVVTLSDVEATFQNNQTYYVPVAGSLSTDLFDVVAGTRLRVTPHISGDGAPQKIRLLVHVQDGSFTSQQVGALPVVQSSGLDTQAIILDGQSLLLGGMVTQATATNTSKIPVLGDVPVAGSLFRSRRNTVSHIERLFLITPHVTSPGEAVHPPVGAVPIVLSRVDATADSPAEAQ